MKKFTGVSFVIYCYCLTPMCLISCGHQPKKAESIPKNTQVKKVKADTVTGEAEILNLILNLEEVKRKTMEVEKASKGKRTLATYLETLPTEVDPNYWVKVAEDNGDSFVTYYTFNVNAKDHSISFYDSLQDSLITLSEWRRAVPLKDR